MRRGFPRKRPATPSPPPTPSHPLVPVNSSLPARRLRAPAINNRRADLRNEFARHFIHSVPLCRLRAPSHRSWSGRRPPSSETEGAASCPPSQSPCNPSRRNFCAISVRSPCNLRVIKLRVTFVISVQSPRILRVISVSWRKGAGGLQVVQDDRLHPHPQGDKSHTHTHTHTHTHLNTHTHKHTHAHIQARTL